MPLIVSLPIPEMLLLNNWLGQDLALQAGSEFLPKRPREEVMELVGPVSIPLLILKVLMPSVREPPKLLGGEKSSCMKCQAACSSA